MSTKELMEQMDALLEMHERLLEVSIKKTGIIKNGEVDRLSDILVEERKLVQTVVQVENARMETTELLYKQLAVPPENDSLQALISFMDKGEERQFLLERMTRLVEVITSLKTNETLNKQLIEQSMQFVHLSLNMMDPTMDQINYSEHKEETKDYMQQRSVFDSKA